MVVHRWKLWSGYIGYRIIDRSAVGFGKNLLASTSAFPAWVVAIGCSGLPVSRSGILGNSVGRWLLSLAHLSIFYIALLSFDAFATAFRHALLCTFLTILSRVCCASLYACSFAAVRLVRHTLAARRAWVDASLHPASHHPAARPPLHFRRGTVWLAICLKLDIRPSVIMSNSSGDVALLG